MFQSKLGNLTVTDGRRTSGSSQVIYVCLLTSRSKALNFPGKDSGLFCIPVVPSPTLIKSSIILQIINNGIRKKSHENSWNWPKHFKQHISSVGVLFLCPLIS